MRGDTSRGPSEFLPQYSAKATTRATIMALNAYLSESVACSMKVSPNARLSAATIAGTIRS